LDFYICPSNFEWTPDQIKSGTLRVFILGTGRTGSTSIIKACEHIENYSSGHESLTRNFGDKRFDYPENHIEADNRLSWELGRLNQKFGDEPFYVHLKREKKEIAKSYFKRFFKSESIMDAFCSGMRMVSAEKQPDKIRFKACLDYVDTVDANINLFVSNKSKVLVMNLESIEEDFKVFWDKIEAKGDFKAAISDLRKPHNATSKPDWNIRNRLKIAFLREWKHFQMTK